MNTMQHTVFRRPGCVFLTLPVLLATCFFAWACGPVHLPAKEPIPIPGSITDYSLTAGDLPDIANLDEWDPYFNECDPQGYEAVCTEYPSWTGIVEATTVYFEDAPGGQTWLKQEINRFADVAAARREVRSLYGASGTRYAEESVDLLDAGQISGLHTDKASIGCNYEPYVRMYDGSRAIYCGAVLRYGPLVVYFSGGPVIEKRISPEIFYELIRTIDAKMEPIWSMYP